MPALALAPLLALACLVAAPQDKPQKAQHRPQKQEKGGGNAQDKDQRPIKVIEEAPSTGPKVWDPRFDYTNLPPSTAALWQVAQGAVPLEKVLAFVAETEGKSVRVILAEQRPGSPAVWYLQLFLGGEDGNPERLNLQVASDELKVLKRTALRSMPDDERAVWVSLAECPVPAEVAIQLALERGRGDLESNALDGIQVRKLTFVPDLKPVYRCEVIGQEHTSQVLRRYEMEVSAKDPKVRKRLLIDRFPGEPLRASEPVELRGMFVHDFEVGDGEEVHPDSKVRVNYRLFLLDGSKFYDTWKDQREETFLVSQAPLKGITAGMEGMRVGGRRKIAIPYELAFGEAGGELAPPRAMVVCDIQVEGLATE